MPSSPNSWYIDENRGYDLGKTATMREKEAHALRNGAFWLSTEGKLGDIAKSQGLSMPKGPWGLLRAH